MLGVNLGAFVMMSSRWAAEGCYSEPRISPRLFIRVAPEPPAPCGRGMNGAKGFRRRDRGSTTGNDRVYWEL